MDVRLDMPWLPLPTGKMPVGPGEKRRMERTRKEKEKGADAKGERSGRERRKAFDWEGPGYRYQRARCPLAQRRREERSENALRSVLEEPTGAGSGELSVRESQNSVHKNLLNARRKNVRPKIGRVALEVLLAPDEDICESSLPEKTSILDLETTRRDGRHPCDRFLSRKTESPYAPIELRHRSVCARMRMIRRQGTPGCAKRGVASGNDPGP